MITFTDGPAVKTTLTLARAPFLLRVVIDQAGRIDALDRLEDEPRPGETVHVYRILTANPAIIHIDRTNPKTGKREGLWSVSAQYRLAKLQPPASVAADTRQWRAWATEHAKQA